MRESRKRIEGEVVSLDYGTFRDQVFVDCKLVYEGGGPPSLTNCEFIDSEFVFEGRAKNTARFITAMADAESGLENVILEDMLGLKSWARKDG